MTPQQQQRHIILLRSGAAETSHVIQNAVRYRDRIPVLVAAQAADEPIFFVEIAVRVLRFCYVTQNPEMRQRES